MAGKFGSDAAWSTLVVYASEVRSHWTDYLDEGLFTLPVSDMFDFPNCYFECIHREVCNLLLSSSLNRC